ncbi:Protein FMP42 [Cytospora mali]|uniref:Protein FMP42 n=1 Tax=Cytospora mali TaxID=578113 RepID=A0A194W2L6_CYTMA|nr:Protein FMP42 [Valsa mali]
MPCPEQDMRLNLFFIMASITLNMSTVLAGYVLDNHGRRMCYLLAAAILSLGGGCMAVAFYMGEGALAHFDGYITGNLLLGLGGTFLFVSSYQLSNAFPRHAGLVVALVTGAFDASAAVFLFYRLAYEATSHAFKPAYFFLGFAVLTPLLIVVAEFTLMPSAGYNTRREYQVAIEYAKDSTRDVHDSDDETYANKPREELQRMRWRRASEREAQLEAIEAVAGNEDERRADREVAWERQATSGVYGFLHCKPVGRQMMTAWFWLLLGLTVLQMMRMNYFIATVRAQYRYMLDGEEGAEKVNSLFDVALPVAGVITTPFIGVLLNEVPVYGTLGVLSVLIVILGAFNCVSTLWAGYATVVVFVIFRPLYYSAVSDYASKVFGFATFGRIYGTIICVSGIGQFVQPALDTLTHGPLHNNPVPVNLFFAIGGSVISAALTFYVYVKTVEHGKGHGGKSVDELRFGEDLADDERRSLLHDGVRGDGYGSAVRDGQDT